MNLQASSSGSVLMNTLKTSTVVDTFIDPMNPTSANESQLNLFVEVLRVLFLLHLSGGLLEPPELEQFKIGF